MRVFTNIIIALICILVAIFFFFYWAKESFTKLDPEKLQGRAQAKIYAIVPREEMSQSRWKGTEIRIVAYDISYTYSIDGSFYQQTDVIPVNNITIPFIKEAKEHYQTDLFTVRYSIKNPEYSLLEGDTSLVEDVTTKSFTNQS